MVGVSRPIVKHSFLVNHAADIPGIVKKAFYLATSGRPGPVVIDVPKNVTNPLDKFEYVYPESVKMRSYNPSLRGHSGQVKKAIKALLQAKKPVIYSGGGVINANASELLTELTKKLNFPITNTLMGLGAYPGTDPQFLGMLGMHGTYEANNAMHYADFILAVGARFDDRVTNTCSKFCPSATIVHIDIDPTSISKTINAHIPIVGSVEVVLQQLLDQLNESLNDGATLDKEAHGNWWNQIEEWRDAHGLWTAPRYPTGTGQIMPQEVIESLYRATNGDAYVTSDVGQHQMFAAQYYRFDKPRRWINSGGLGTMGFGFPAALGVKIAHPDADVACVTGEGSIQMCIQEMATSTHYSLPVKIINLNNGYLGMVKQWQDMQYGSRYSHVSYADSLPDFVKLAEAYGHVGMKVENLEDLEPAMKECFALKDRLVFMDIMVNPHEHVYPMHVAPNGSMRDMWLSKTERT